MLSAIELRRSKRSVLLLERNTTGKESSWAGGGIISPLYPWRYSDPVTALAIWGQQHYAQILAELADITGIDPQHEHTGLLILEPGDDTHAIDWANEHKMPMEVVSAEQSQFIEPEVGVARKGIWMPSIGNLRNPRIVKALRRLLEIEGIDIRENTEVGRILSNKGKVTGVSCNHGDFSSDQVLVAGGAWSAELVKGLGSDLGIEPVLGQMILFKAPPGFLKRMVLYKDRYAIPRRDGRVLMGSTLEHVGFNKKTTDWAREELKASALELIPKLANFDIEHHWAGLRPGKTDNIPVISQHPEINGLFVNAGHFRNGVILGPASARLIADLMLRREPILNPSPYSL